MKRRPTANRLVGRSTGSSSIAHVIWSLGLGGAERALYQLVRAQRARGLAVDVVVATTTGLYGERLREEGACVAELRQKSGIDITGARRAARIFAGYDIIHFHSPEPLLIREAAGLDQRKLFYTHRAGLFSYPLKRRLKYLAMGRYLRKTFSTSANTKQGARAASRLFHIPIDSVPILYNGIDFSLLAPTRQREEVLAEFEVPGQAVWIGSSGNLRPWKRMERLLHALHGMPGNVRCMIIGDGPERPSLERLSEELGIADRVAFVGSTGRVGDYLQALDVFVLPSGPEESFGNAAVEAMGVGLPTVVFADGGGLTEHVEHRETGFVANDQEDLVDRLSELVRDHGLRTRLGTAASASVRAKYSIDAMVDRYDDLYAGRLEALADKAPPIAMAR